MYNYMTYADIAVLLSLNFKMGIASYIYWGIDKEGNHWQVIDDGRWLMFAKRNSTGSLSPHQRMSSEQFSELFR